MFDPMEIWILVFFLLFVCFVLFILFFNSTILYWFCHTSTWIRHRYTRVPHPEPSSFLPPRTIPLSLPSAPAPSNQYWSSNLDWQLVGEGFSLLFWFMSVLHLHLSFWMDRIPKEGRVKKQTEMVHTLSPSKHKVWTLLLFLRDDELLGHTMFMLIFSLYYSSVVSLCARDLPFMDIDTLSYSDNGGE